MRFSHRQDKGGEGACLGVQISWMLAARHPSKIDKLVVMEGLLGDLPGAEQFLSGGPPWWFGFHRIPGLAEAVLEGHEADYIDWFLRAGTKAGNAIDETIRQAFLAAYSTKAAMRCGFEHYRAFPQGAAQLRSFAAVKKMDLPILAIAGGVVGDALARQLAPISSRLETLAIPDCAHLIPLEQPSLLECAIRQFIDAKSELAQGVAANSRRLQTAPPS